MDSKTRVTIAQKTTIDHLAECEECMAELYGAYGRALPEMAGFWEELVKEEKAHARMLKSLHQLLDKGNLFFDIGRFDRKAIASQIARVKYETAIADTTHGTPQNALTTAIAIEASLIEGEFYEVVKSDAREFRIMAEHLLKATVRHRDCLRAELARAGAA